MIFLVVYRLFKVSLRSRLLPVWMDGCKTPPSPYLTILCLPYLTLTCCTTTPYHIMLRHNILCHHTIPYHTIPHLTILCCTTTYHVMPATPYHTKCADGGVLVCTQHTSRTYSSPKEVVQEVRPKRIKHHKYAMKITHRN